MKEVATSSWCLRRSEALKWREIRFIFDVLQKNQDRNCRALQETIEYMNAKQSGLLAAMDTKNSLMKEAPEEEVKSKFFKEVLILAQGWFELEDCVRNLKL